MGGFLVVGETAPDGTLTRLSSEVATLARRLAESAGSSVTGSLTGGSEAAAAEFARFTGGRVVACTATDTHATGSLPATIVDDARGLAADADIILVPASPNGRDVAGILSALLGVGVLANATAVRWDGGPVVEMSAFGGKLITESAFTTARGIVTIRPNVVTAEAAATPGAVETAPAHQAAETASATLVERVAQPTAAVSIDDARIIVAGGRGVGGPEGFRLIEDLAEALGGAVGATRAAVDSGWIPYAQQIGQTGKIVKPQLYLAVGISGAIQHKVGMQTSGTIVAINRDPDAPIAEFADVLVVGDLFEVGPALVSALQARSD